MNEAKQLAITHMVTQSKRWTQEEVEKLKECAPNHNNNQLLELFPNRTTHSIAIKISRLKIDRTELSRLWSKTEDIIIRGYYKNSEKEKIIEKLSNKRSWGAIGNRAHFLGLERNSYRFLKMQRQIKVPPPSEDFAWFLGVLAGDGCVINKKGQYSISLQVTDKTFAQKFGEMGNDLFGIEFKFYMDNRYNKNKNWNNMNICRFNSKRMVEHLGDWGEHSWVTTLKENFDWIIKNEEYITKFLEGFFDSEGTVRYDNKIGTYQIVFAIQDIKAHIFIKDLLNKIDLKPKTYTLRGKEKSLCLIGKGECQKFANKIKSVIERKEQNLIKFRNLKIVTERLICKKCSHSWIPKQNQFKVKTCPKCRTSKWLMQNKNQQ